MTTTRYLTDAEVQQAALNRLRLQHGLSATPDQHPAYFKTCLLIAETAAAGDAFYLLAVNDDAREMARRAPQPMRRPAKSYNRRVAGSGVRWA